MSVIVDYSAKNLGVTTLYILRSIQNIKKDKIGNQRNDRQVRSLFPFVNRITCTFKYGKLISQAKWGTTPLSELINRL